MSEVKIERLDLTPQNLVDHLKDIHLPEPITWWPVAPGWWAIFVLLIAAAIYLAVTTFKRKDNNLTSSLERLHDELVQTEDTASYAHQITQILREIVNKGPAGNQVRALHGSSLVEWIEQNSGAPLSIEARALLSETCYQKTPPKPQRSTHDEIAQWITTYATLHSSVKSYSPCTPPVIPDA